MPVETLFFDGGKYEGETADGQPHGKGKYTWENGDVYDGEWVDNVQCGRGVFLYADGGRYEGEWADDQPNGRGKMKFANGAEYEGEWKFDKMHGKGVLRTKEGRVYDGMFADDKKNGWGKETGPDGSTFEGEWTEGKKNGKGYQSWANGDIYDGDYREDQKSGRGTFKWSNGDTYNGEVKANGPHGTGIYRHANGDWRAGQWIEGSEAGQQETHKANTSRSSAESVDDLGMSIETLQLESSVRQKRDFTSEDVNLDNLDFNGWRRGPLLGKGSFGSVFLGLLKSGKSVAVKVVEFGTKEDQSELAAFQNELDMMRRLKHPNIVRYLGTQYERDTKVLNIFLEYVPLGSLSSAYKKFNTLHMDTVRKYTRQILEGLQYLHSHHIVHRDIKGDNILLDDEGTVKLADFGCSKKLDELCSKTHGCNTMVGTPYWMAPEVITNDSGYGIKADIWSVGCTVIELLTGQPPWPEFSSMWAAIYHIANSEGPPSGIPEDVEPSCRAFLNECFIRDVSKRPDCSSLLQHPFITGESAKAWA